jgi:hypothetical protein
MKVAERASANFLSERARVLHAMILVNKYVRNFGVAEVLGAATYRFGVRRLVALECGDSSPLFADREPMRKKKALTSQRTPKKTTCGVRRLVTLECGDSSLWSAATCRRFLLTAIYAKEKSADKSAHSKKLKNHRECLACPF